MRMHRRAMFGSVAILVIAGCDGGGSSGSGGAGAGATTGIGGAPASTSASAGGAGGTGGTGTGGTGGTGTGGTGGAASSSSSASSASSSSSSSSSSSGMNTPCAGPKCDVTVVGTAFGEHEGQTVHVGFVPQGSLQFSGSASAVVQNGTFMISLPQTLTKNLPYFMNYYADVNGNQTCDIGADHIWRKSLPSVTENLFLTIVHDQNYSNLGCGGF